MDDLEKLRLMLSGQKYSDLTMEDPAPDRSPAGSSEYVPLKQDPISIEASPLVEGKPQVINPVGDTPKYDVPKFTLKNSNDILNDQMDSRDKLRSQLQDSQSGQDELVNRQKKMIDSLGDVYSSYKPDASRAASIKSLTNSYNKSDIGDRDLMTQAILSLGPAVLGSMFGGDSGRAAVLPAMNGAQALYETIRKEDLARSKMSKEEIKAKIAALQSLEKQDQDSFYKNQNNIKSALDLKAKIETNLLNAKGKEKEDIQKQLNDINNIIPKEALAQTNEIAHQEQNQQKIDIDKNKAAGSKNEVKNKDWVDMQHDMDASKRGQGNYAAAQKMVNRAGAMNVLFQQYPDFNIPKMNTAELSTGIAAMISGGQPQSQEQIRSLTPHSLAGDVSGIVGWLYNDPKGLGQQEFMKGLQETVRREKEFNTDLMANMREGKMGAYEHLYASDPARYKRAMGVWGIQPNEIGPHGEYLLKKDSNGSSVPKAPYKPKGNYPPPPAALSPNAPAAKPMSLADKIKKLKELTK